MRPPRILAHGIFVTCSSILLHTTHLSSITTRRRSSRGEAMVRAVLAVVALALGRRKAAFALPHEVIPLPGTTEALSLNLYVKSSVGDAHFVAVPSSAKVPPAAVTAEVLVDPRLSNEVFKTADAKNGSFPVRASERSAYIIDGLIAGQAYDVFYMIEAANSNGLFSPVGRVLGVSTNALAPAISSLTVAPTDARTNATELSLSMDAVGVACRVWYAVLPLVDTVFLSVEEITAQEIADAAQPGSVVDFPQGLKGMRSPRPIIDNLDSDTWYQVSAVSERVEGVFGEPIHAVAKTHREPARVIETKVAPVQGSTDSISLLTALDCSSTPVNEACGRLSYRVTETPPRGSPQHVKPRQVAQGNAAITDGRSKYHVVPGLSPGKAYSITMAIESPGSNGAFGPTWEAAATTFPRAPGLVAFGVSRSETKASTVTVRYKLSEPGLLHVSLVEKLGHPSAMIGTIVGNQHGVSFTLEVGIPRDGDNDGVKELVTALEGSQELHDLEAGSAFEVTAQTESTLLGRKSSVYGETQATMVEAVPPILTRVRASPLDATTTEVLLEYEVVGTVGRMYYALTEAEAAATGGKESLKHSAEAVKSAVQGAGGVLVTGSTFISPEERSSGSSIQNRINTTEGGYDTDAPPPVQRLRFRGLEPKRRYVISLCTESNSGSLSGVTVAEAEAHGEAPLVVEMTALPADGSAEALSLAFALESSGLVHFVVRQAAEDQNVLVSRDHTIVYRGTREVNGTSSSAPPQHQLPAGAGAAGKGGVEAAGAVVETVENLEPNSTYEIFVATETSNSNGVYRANPEPLLATTHPMPPLLLDARARAADASSSALLVTVSLESLAEVHYAVFPITSAVSPHADHAAPASGRDKPAQGRVDNGMDVEGERSTRDDKGAGSHGGALGCANIGAAVDGMGMPAALNETRGLVASGVVASKTIAGMITLAGEGEAGVNAAAASSASAVADSTTTSVGAGGQSKSLAASRLSEGDALDVEFRVEGLQAAQAYSVCLFTETPNSNGLFGSVHELRSVSTHAPVPELASERVACTVDCPGLNRDPCWLEANRCGECRDGFDGKAGHVNSPCGKVASLTEEDIARIADRERAQAQGDQVDKNSSSESQTAKIHSEKSRNIPLTPPGSSRIIGSPASSQLSMGIPIAVGPNVTKFFYVEVPAVGTAGQQNDDFDVGTAAAHLCEELRKEGLGGELPTCKANLSATLRTRFKDGRFHQSDDPGRPILQVEVDAPGGESLAFILRGDEEEGNAVVGFCRENSGVLPDEQDCVVSLMQEMAA